MPHVASPRTRHEGSTPTRCRRLTAPNAGYGAVQGGGGASSGVQERTLCRGWRRSFGRGDDGHSSSVGDFVVDEFNRSNHAPEIFIGARLFRNACQFRPKVADLRC